MILAWNSHTAYVFLMCHLLMSQWLIILIEGFNSKSYCQFSELSLSFEQRMTSSEWTIILNTMYIHEAHTWSTLPCKIKTLYHHLKTWYIYTVINFKTLGQISGQFPLGTGGSKILRIGVQLFCQTIFYFTLYYFSLYWVFCKKSFGSTNKNSRKG